MLEWCFIASCLALGHNNYVKSELKPKLRRSQDIFFLPYAYRSPLTIPRIYGNTSKMGRPKKRARLLEDASDASGDEATPTFTINDEYAKRFQHNKAREERQRLEEKYGKDAENLEETDASTSEEEDDEAELATLELDAQISETLNALRSKDPRIYDKQTVFFKDDDTSAAAVASRKTKEKPIRLQDYHRANLLAGKANGDDEEEDDAPMTYADEQAAAKRDFLAQTNESDDEDDESDGGALLVKKPGQAVQAQSPPRKQQKHAEPDIAAADANPEGFLDKFMASRAWEPKGTANYQPFESEDESDVERAEAWEAAYNMRFEDPARANEKLLSHSRDAAAKYSVRREEVTGRKKTREAEKAKKDAIKAERDSDKARLRRLKIDEAQEKLQKFREAAGLTQGKEVSVEEWAKFLEAGFEDDNWDAEMAKRFGEDYYANGEHAEGDEDGDEDVAMADDAAPAKKKKKVKTSKPKWDDDIDIGDLVPDFIAEEEEGGKHITLTDDEAEEEPEEDDSDKDGEDAHATTEAPSHRTKTTKKDRERARLDARRTARLDRAAIESVVDTHLSRTLPSSATAARFRYRETSPSTYGLTSLDILLADDAELNAYVGLKKMATFREPEKKRKDKKRLGKKARLREWRRDAFGAGREDGPSVERWDELFKSGQRAGEEDNVNTSAIGGGGVGASKGIDGEGDVVEGKRKNKRSRKRKAGAIEGVDA